jgi:cell division protein FtsQ
VPVVSGTVTKSFATGKLFDFVSFIVGDPFWNAQIEQIYIREDLKIVLVPRVGDATIVLGKLDNYELKLEKLYRLYKGGFNTMGWNHYEKIDLQYDNQIVCTKKGLKTTHPKIEIVQNNDSSTVKKI